MISADWRRTATVRRAVFFTLVGLTSCAALFLLTGAFQQNGLTPLELALLLVYALLMVWISLSFWTAALGFLVLLFGGDRVSLARRSSQAVVERDLAPLRTAVIVPICNEDPKRVFAGLKAVWQALEETGNADRFELFILSDTRDPKLWMEEEVRWYGMCEAFAAHGRIFYRNREFNLGRKSGNIEEFCRRWGGRYRYMIVLDADSLVGGPTLVRMVELMEANPQVALIQSPPLPVNQSSLFARILQFASNLYGAVFTAGAAWWQLGEANYYGHNAIIRVAPFMRHCGLPKLKGREPFGGEILSHDFVEAALLRRAGWEVWLVPELTESYEELPPTLIDYAKRDRRWCQGNLQHLKVMFARGLCGISRLHLAMGIMSYLSSPLWLLFLLLTALQAYVQSQTPPVYFFGDNLFPVWPESYAVEMTTVLVVTLSMLFLPKLLSLLLLLLRQRQKLKQAGGFLRVLASMVLETLFSALIAPVLMLYQSKFVVAILLRRSVGWPPQQRDARRLSLKEAVVAHGGQTLIGMISGILSYLYIPDFFWWFTPVLAGLLLVIPISMLSSSTHLGSLARKLGLFLIPEESHPPGILQRFHHYLAQEPSAREDEELLCNPGVCALHASLLANLPLKRKQWHQLQAILCHLMEEGIENLSPPEKRSLLSRPETLARLHFLLVSQRP
jgi:membrane glycosyltransferase